jgi:hypothetical protein
MVNKSDTNNPAITEFPIPEFTGWCIYGYWLNGQLLNRAEYRKQFSASNRLKQSILPQSQVKFRSWRREMNEKHRVRLHRKLPEAARGISESQYHIPTLNEWGAL